MDSQLEWSDWERIVSTSPEATYFQTHHWARLLSTVFPQMTPHGKVYRLSQGHEVLVPAMVVRRRWGMPHLESMPMGGYGGPVSSAPLRQEDLLQLEHLVLSPSLWALTVYPSPTSRTDLSHWGDPVPFYSHVLSLDGGFAEVWSSRFDRKLRNQVRKAERSAVELSVASDPDQWRTFARLYRRKSSQWTWQGYPERMFLLLADHEAPHVRLWLAHKEQSLLSGLVVLSWGDHAVPWASAMEEGSGSFCPNHALYRQAIECACGEGRRWFNFGSSRELPALHMFKESFGAQRIDYCYYRWEPAWKRRLKRLLRPRQLRGSELRDSGFKPSQRAARS
jgi:hypothetical protein